MLSFVSSPPLPRAEPGNQTAQIVYDFLNRANRKPAGERFVYGGNDCREFSGRPTGTRIGPGFAAVTIAPEAGVAARQAPSRRNDPLFLRTRPAAPPLDRRDHLDLRLRHRTAGLI